MSKLVYLKGFPEELERIVHGYLTSLEWMIPRWCEHVNVVWVDDGSDSSASIAVHFEYRFAELEIHPTFMSCTEDERRDTCIHEFIHLHVNPLYNFADRTFKVLIEDAKLQAHSLEELRRYCEGVTQDLTHVVFERLNERETGSKRKH